MSKTSNYDTKIKSILDALEPGERICELTGEKWKMTQEEIGWYKKFNVPPSAYAPHIKMLISASHGGCYQWWYQKHPETGKQLLTCAHPASGIKVLPDKEWHDRDFSNIQVPYDANTPFFDVIYKLERAVPVMATRNRTEPVNSISILSQADENDIVTFWCKARNSLFSIAMIDGENSSEIFFGNSVTNCYNTLHSDRIFNCKYLRYSHDCMNSSFLFDCRNCQNCFGAVNKRNAEYVFWGEQLSKEEYEKRVSQIDLSCRSNLQVQFAKFQKMVHEAVWPESFNIHCENSVGEHLNKCTDCSYCYSSGNGTRGLFWCHFTYDHSENCAFVDGGVNATDCYNSLGCIQSQNCKFCHTTFDCQSLEYCMHCSNCENCFGCVGLNRKQFCIFNKQYEKEEYWKCVDELKCNMLDRGEYGKLFPASHSPSAFLESTEAMMMGLCNKDMAQKIHANVFDSSEAGAVGDAPAKGSLNPEDVPDCLADIDESWTKKPVFDKEIGRRFAFFQQEIDFHKRMNIALSNRHFMARAKALLAEVNVAQYDRFDCGKCGKEVWYAKNPTYTDKKIYCHECYLQYIEKYS
ncbi:MAG: hypothetical protein ABIH21_00850 [Patescibacteria group bacterium]